MTTHTCAQCGHTVKHNGLLDGPVEHLDDGRHKYSVVVSIGGKITFK